MALLGPLLGVLTGGVLGEKAAEAAGTAVERIAEKVFGPAWEEARTRARAYLGGVPTNHDLERALRLAQLTGALVVLWDFAREEEDARFDNRSAEPPAFVTAARHFLHDQLGLLPSLTFKDNDAVAAALEAALDDALADARRDGVAATGRDLVAEAEQAVWQELVDGTGGSTPLPPEFKARFFSRDPEAPGWAACFLAFFREALKDHPRVQVAFVASRLAALKRAGATLEPLVRGIAGDIGAMRPLLGRVADDVVALHGKHDRTDAKLDEIARKVEQLRRDPPPDWAGELRRVLTPQVPNLEFIPDERLPAVVEKLLTDARAGTAIPPDAAAPVRAALAAAEARIAEFDLSSAAGDLDALIARRREERERRAADDAALLVERARVSRLQLRYHEAAAMLREAAGLVAFDRQAAWRHLLAAADALLDQGDEFGDNAALREAIALYTDALRLVPRHERAARLGDDAEQPRHRAREPRRAGGGDGAAGGGGRRLPRRAGGTHPRARAARLGDDAEQPRQRALRRSASGRRARRGWRRRSPPTARRCEERTRERVPLDWAMTQNNLGTALWTLGEREAGTARLEEAVAAYRAALEERTRERVPLDWAMTQNNLGTALWTLGEREAGTARLEEAVAAYRAALEECTRERVPLDWAMTQNNLGNALQALGEREAGTARLEEAVAAYRAALEERTRERVPLDWAGTQNNLGNALRALGEREAGTARLEEAVAAYRAALEERTRERVPLDWAATQNNLGNALRALGEREAGTARLEEAVAAYRAALEECTRERVPLDWARTQNNLGNALRTLGEREAGTARLEEAVAAYRAALEERTRERVPLDWATTQNNLGNALRALGEREAGTARLEEAVAAYRAALEERTRERVPLDWAMSTGNQGVALMLAADRVSEATMAEMAVRADRDCLGDDA